jgi:hypothetical protein
LNQGKNCDSSSSSSSRFRKKYRDILLFNRNLLLSGILGFFVSILATKLIVELDINSALDISILTIVIGYCSSKPLFIFLFHRDNNHKYADPFTGRIDSKIMNRIIKQLIVAYLIFDLVYLISRFMIMYGLLLDVKIGPLEATIFSSLCASILSYFSTNVTIKIGRMFKLGKPW